MLGDNIKSIRVEKKLGLNETARLAGISPSYLSDIEKGNKTNPSIETLEKIATALEVSLISLMGDSKNMVNRFYFIGQMIKEYREKNKLTQEKFAKQCKVNPLFIKRLEKGLDPYGNIPKKEPTILILKRIADTMNKSLKEVALNTGYYDNYDDFMYHQIAINYSIPLVKYLKENDFILKKRIVSFLKEYGYDYVEDNFTFDEAKDFYFNEIIDYDYDEIIGEIEELKLEYSKDKNNRIIFTQTPSNKKPTTIAAHLPEGVELTEEEQKQIEDYVQFILSRREK